MVQKMSSAAEARGHPESSESEWLDEVAVSRWEDDGGAVVPDENGVTFLPTRSVYTSEGGLDMERSDQRTKEDSPLTIAQLLLVEEKNREIVDEITHWAKTQHPHVFKVVSLRLKEQGLDAEEVADQLPQVWHMFCEEPDGRFASKLHRVVAKYDPKKGKFSPYLCKSFGRKVKTTLLAEIMRGQIPVQERVDDGLSPEEQEAYSALHAAIRKLEKQRDRSFLIAWSLGFSEAEIGRALGITEDNARQRFHRLLAKIRPELEQHRSLYSTRNEGADKHNEKQKAIVRPAGTPAA